MGSSSRPHPIVPPPPPPASSQPIVRTNPFPHQGYITTQTTKGHAYPQTSQSSQNDYQILMMNSSEVNVK